MNHDQINKGPLNIEAQIFLKQLKKTLFKFEPFIYYNNRQQQQMRHRKNDGLKIKV